MPLPPTTATEALPSDRARRWKRHLARLARTARVLRAELSGAPAEYTTSVETPGGVQRRRTLEQFVSDLNAPGALPRGWRLGTLDPHGPGFSLRGPAGATLEITLGKPTAKPLYTRTAHFGVAYSGSAPDASAAVDAAVRALRAGEARMADAPGFPRVLLEPRLSEVVLYPQDHRVELRPTLACNHHCGFCNSVDRTTRNVTRGAEELLATLPAWEHLPVLFATVSGGEPTLLKNLDVVVEALADRGLLVELQSNGMALADPHYAARLADAGLGRILISLHAADGALSDAEITRYEGGWARTVAGVDAALACGISVHLSHVIHRANADRAPEFLRMVDARWGRRVHVRLAFVAPAGADSMDLRAHVPSLRDVLPSLREALAFARARRLRLSVMDHCGVPPCLVAPHVSFADASYRAPSRMADDHVKLPACRDCAYEPGCPGLWRDYYRLHGDPGLAPLPRKTHMNRVLRWALLR